MRLFLNAIFDFKPKDKAFVTIPPVLRDALKEGGWTPERFLFDLYDINEAVSEGRTPHAMLMKRFPQLKPYWHNTSARFAAMNPKTAFSDELIPTICSHGYGFFSNFPGRKEGKAVFCPDDSAIDMEVLNGICNAIPRPCSFLSWCGMPFLGIQTAASHLPYAISSRGMVWKISVQEIGPKTMSFTSAA